MQQAQKGWKVGKKHRQYGVCFANRLTRSGQGETPRLCLSSQCFRRKAHRHVSVISRASSSTWKDGCWESTARETESLRQGGGKSAEPKQTMKATIETKAEADVAPLPVKTSVLLTRSKKSVASKETQNKKTRTSTRSVSVPSTRTEPVVQKLQSGGGSYYQSIFFGIALGLAASVGARRRKAGRKRRLSEKRSTRINTREPTPPTTTRRTTPHAQSFTPKDNGDNSGAHSSNSNKRHVKMQYMQASTENKYSVSPVDSSSLQKHRLEEVEKHIDKLYSGLDKMAEENKRSLLLHRSRPSSVGTSATGVVVGKNKDYTEVQKKLGEGLERVEDEQRRSRRLLAKLEKDFEGLAMDKKQTDGEFDEHIKKTSAGFQDAVQALSVMKDKIGEFEAKLSQMESRDWGSGSGGSVDVIVTKLEAVQREQIQSAEEQASKMGEVSQKLEEMSDNSSLVMQELEDLKRSSKESETLARESSELSRSLKRDLDSFDLEHMRSQVDLAVERTTKGLAATPQESVAYDSRRGAEENQIPAIELEINAIKGALEGTRESMKMLGDELSNVTESIQSIKETNKFSLFLHDFYSSLHTHMAKNNYTIQEVFSSFDGDKDGFLSGNELLQLLELLLPDSSESDRKSLVFYVDPTNEDHIKYSRVLQNASNANKSSGTHTVKFHINYYTEPNQHLRICGAHEALGWWRVLDAPCMYEVEHGVWETTLILPGSTLYEYKYVVCDNKEAMDWLPGSNLVLDLPPVPLQSNLSGKAGSSTTRVVHVEDKWSSHPPTEPLDSTVNTRSTIMRMLSAAGGQK